MNEQQFYSKDDVNTQGHQTSDERDEGEQDFSEWLPPPPLAYRATKRVIDIVFSALALALTFPLLIVIAIAIRLTSDGPAMFGSTRLGYRGRPFKLRKFRTMRIHNDPERNKEFIGQLISGTYGSVGDVPVFKLRHDPRVTPFGRFLRRSSLDELPQLWNVLLGDMSLVGPRPALPYESAANPSWNKQRLSVLPGITGLWQVSGKSNTTFKQMMVLDIAYVQQQSIFLDLKILIRTFSAAVQSDKAY